MLSTLAEPFAYNYMTNAMWVSALVGAVCAFLSAYLMLKGWSLIGDALSHSVVPGVAGAYMLGLPFAFGAFLAGGLAAGAMLFLSERSGLKVDVIIGIIFTSITTSLIMGQMAFSGEKCRTFACFRSQGSRCQCRPMMRSRSRDPQFGQRASRRIPASMNQPV